MPLDVSKCRLMIMSNAQAIIDAIDGFLDRVMLKKNKLTTADLLAFVEAKWAEADDGKYDIHQGGIIIGRMVNEYARAKDVAQLKRWLDEMDQHALSKKHPTYIHHYYKGEHYLKCGAEAEALHHLRLCHEENPDYIFTRGQACIDLFNKHLGKPAPSSAIEDDVEDKLSIILPEWSAFFGEEAKLRIEIGGDVGAAKVNKKHLRGIDYLRANQTAILQAILTELLKQYPAQQEIYDYQGDDKRDFMPDVRDIKGFADLMSPVVVHVLSVYQDKFPYIGYQFSCSWDREHAFGAMLLKDRVVEIGGAETAFLNWIARKDQRALNAKR
jgi:hypothetical protein